MTVHVIAAAGLSAFGRGWRGLSRARTVARTDGHALATSHPGVAAFAVADVGDAVPARARKLMSRGALLAASTLTELARAPLPLADAGFYLGVGASAGAMDELGAMLAASIDDDGFSLARFGGAGLAACNPLLAFQLMNNFTLCHAAIQEGVGGPNGAFFSRGGGTVTALDEAARAVEEGDCAIAIAGGADSALHPVTWTELVRDGHAGVIPGEGAALIALGRERGLARLVRVELRAIDEVAAVAARWDRARPPALVIAGDPAIASTVRAICPDVSAIDLARAVGETLAAAPALGWLAALDAIADGASRACVLSAGLDGQLGVVELEAT